jgi:hypothetical protein
VFSGVPSKEDSGHLEVFEAVSVCSSFPMAGLENRSKGGLRGGPWGWWSGKSACLANVRS